MPREAPFESSRLAARQIPADEKPLKLLEANKLTSTAAAL